MGLILEMPLEQNLSDSQYTTKNNNSHQWYVIVNPAAASGKAKRLWKAIKQELDTIDIDYVFEFTTHKSHAIALVQQAIKSGKINFIAVGGDGTLNEVVNGVFLQSDVDTKEIAIANIPIGTGNDWIKTHKIEQNYQEAIRIIKKSKTKLHDVGSLTYRSDNKNVVKYFINVAGFGFDAAVVKKSIKLGEKGLKGKHGYIIGMLMVMMKYNEQVIRLKTLDNDIEKYIFNLNIGICRFNGGGMMVVPHAVFDDGNLAMTLVEKISRFKIIRNFLTLFTGTFIKLDEVMTMKSKTFFLHSDEEMEFEVDGEMIGSSKVIEVSILPKSIRVISNIE